MKTLPAEQLYYYHDTLTVFMIGVCLFISYLGFSIKNNNYIKYISYGLISFAIAQEILDYTNRIFLDELYHFKLSIDLPLQFCVIGFYFSIFGIYMATSDKKFNSKFEQFIFDCAYVLGFSGAFQALIAVDLTGINNMIGAFALNWAHTLIILNVLWLIFAYGIKFGKKGILQAFLFTNILVLIVGPINYFLNSNYMFLCRPPVVNNPFLIGEWPYYLLTLELIFFIYGYVLYLPFKLIKSFK